MTRTLHLAQEPDADALLSRDPLALLIGMLLDQQVPMETAFAGPKKIADRMDGLSANRIADADPEEFASLCATPPAVHRFPGSMAKRIQALCAHLVENYEGDAEALWTKDNPDGNEVLRQLQALPGYGPEKSRIFVALLGKQLDLKAAGWRAAAGVYGEDGAYRSIADVVDTDSLAKVRAFKKQKKAAAKQQKK